MVDFECRKLTGKKLVKYICSATGLESNEIEKIENLNAHMALCTL